MQPTATAVLLLVMAATAAAHDWGVGACPRISAKAGFDPAQFLGEWYVIEQFDTSSKCLTLTYSKVSETQLRVTKNRQFGLLDSAGIDHTNSYSGTLDIPDAANEGAMRVKWPLNLMGKGDYVVFETDYTGYAGIYECQPVSGLMHRKSASILSRTTSLSSTTVESLKSKLRSSGIDVSDFDVISHANCRSKSESDFNVHVDSDTFRNIMNGARDGIQNVTSSIADGFRRTFGGSTQSAGDPSVDFGFNTATAVDKVDDTLEETVHSASDAFKPVESAVDNVGESVRTAIQKFGADSKPEGDVAPEVPLNVGIELPRDGPVKNFDAAAPAKEDVLPEGTFDNIDVNINNIDGAFDAPSNTDSIKENTHYNIGNSDADVVPVDDVVRTVVTIKKK